MNLRHFSCDVRRKKHNLSIGKKNYISLVINFRKYVCKK